MTAWRGIGFAGGAAMMAVVATAVASAGTEVVALERPRGAAETCSTSPGWPVGSAREFTDRSSLVVGPVAVEHAGVVFSYAEAEGEIYNKLLVHVKGGHRVTLELPRSLRPDVGLGFGRPQGAAEPPRWNLRNSRRVVTFSACPRSNRSGIADEWPVTGWVGWLLARSPGCLRLRVWVDDEPAPRQTLIRFGVRDCG